MTWGKSLLTWISRKIIKTAATREIEPNMALKPSGMYSPFVKHTIVPLETLAEACSSIVQVMPLESAMMGLYIQGITLI